MKKEKQSGVEKPPHLKRIYKNEPDMTPEQALGVLRDEIVHEVKLISSGRKMSMFELVEKGKEYIDLETQIQAAIDSSKEELAAEF